MSIRQFGCVAIALCGCAGGSLASCVQAAVTTYTDRTAWLTAAGPLSGTEDFNSFVADATFQNVSVPLNNMTVTGTTGVNGAATQKIDAPAFEFADHYDWDGTAYLLGDLDGDSQFFRIDFLTPVVAWGVDTIAMADLPRTTSFNIYSASDALLGTIAATSPDDNSTRKFYGFELTSDSASYLVVRNSTDTNDAFSFDNIGFVTVPEPAGTVPALAAFLGLRRARRLLRKR
jgi:hypothetical protein